VQSGYLFGAISDGKWIKADETAKLIGDETTYRVYGLTQALGEAKAGKPKPEEAPCEETLSVSLSPETEKGVIAIAAPWNALPRKPQVTDPTQKTYVDSVRDFLKTKGIEQPKVKIDNIVRVDLDGDGEEEVLISATNYFRKDESVPMRSPAASYSMVLLRRVVAGKVETQLIAGEFYPKAYPKAAKEEGRFDAPNAYKVIATLDLDGDGKMEIVINAHYLKEKRQRFTGAIQRRVRLYFLWLAVRDTDDRCEKDIGIRGYSDWYALSHPLKRKTSSETVARQGVCVADT
jgi:hypothetical protein